MSRVNKKLFSVFEFGGALLCFAVSEYLIPVPAILLDGVVEIGDGFDVCRVIGEQYRSVSGITMTTMLAICSA